MTVVRRDVFQEKIRHSKVYHGNHDPGSSGTRPETVPTGPAEGEARMSRIDRPIVAIGEAKQKAAAWGFDLVIIETQKKIPFDFAIDDRGCTSLIRVRRIKFPQFGTTDIERACAQEVQELRMLPVPEGIYRELWVRGPGRAWHRYLSFRDR